MRGPIVPAGLLKGVTIGWAGFTGATWGSELYLAHAGKIDAMRYRAHGPADFVLYGAVVVGAGWGGK